MIYFCEPTKVGNEHAMINSSIINIFATIYSSIPIVFLGDKTYFEGLNLSFFSKTEFVKVLKPDDGNKMVWLRKFFGEVKIIWSVLRNANRDRVSRVVFLSCSPIGNCAVQFFSRLFFRKTKITVVLHGELEYVRPGAKLRPVERLLSYALKSSFFLCPNHSTYLVLGKSIKDKLIRLEVVKPSRLLCIEHPYRFSFQSSSQKDIQLPLVFAQFGVGKLAKQSDVFLDLAKRISNKYGSEYVNFQILGRILPEIEFALNDFVEYQKQSDMVSQEDYEMQCAKIHYSIFLYTDENYGLTSSGAFMDAIKFQKPVLCLRNSFFDRLFSDTPFQFGWIFDTVEELELKINSLIKQHDQKEYNLMVDNVSKLAELYSDHAAIALLKPQLIEQ